jgi:hypothetical protein
MTRAAGLEFAASAVTVSWTVVLASTEKSADGTACAWKCVVDHALVCRHVYHGCAPSTSPCRDTNWCLSVATTLVQTHPLRYEQWTLVKQLYIPFGSIATLDEKLSTGIAAPH